MHEKDKIRALVMASPELNDVEKFYEELDDFINRNKFFAEVGWYKSRKVELVTCGCPKIDRLVTEYANGRGYKLTTIKANFIEDKSNAIDIRNAKASNLANCFIAFWDAESFGIKNMIDKHMADDVIQLYVYVKDGKIKDNGKPPIKINQN